MRGRCRRTCAPRWPHLLVVLLSLCVLSGAVADDDRLPIEPKADATPRERALVWLTNAQTDHVQAQRLT